MTRIETFEVGRNDLSRTRVVTAPAPVLKAGEILVRVDRFALTANNITYGVVGEKIGYWKFFPAGEGFGVIPVWGFADVVEANASPIEVGERLYGYFPMGTHLVIRPEKASAERFVDVSPHRAGLPPVYNSYARNRGEPHFDKAMENERMLLFPLYATSFCLYDFLVDNRWFGAAQIIIVSASSKTAIGLADALAADKGAPRVVGVTSPQNAAFVRGLGLYASVATYDALDAIDDRTPAVIVDMSGDGRILADLHRRLGDNMRFCSNVGVTHYAESEMRDGFIRERSAMFFAPGHIQKRAADWGPGVFEKKAFMFWRDAAARSRAFLKIEKAEGLKAMEEAYHRLRAGKTPPDRGVIVELAA